MKKVLLIGYPFPLRRGGSPRLLGLAKYLPEFDWEPIILSAPLEALPDIGLRIIETPYHDSLHFWKKILGLKPNDDIRSQVKQKLGVSSSKSWLDFILTRLGEIVNYPDSEKGWRPSALKTGDELLKQEAFDAIISTSAPFTAHIVARELKIKHGIPWLADLRDLWSQNHNYTYSPLRKFFDKRLEIKTLAEADALVTVSSPWAEKLKTLHPDKVVHTITNGFDPVQVNAPPAPLTPKFTITYTGLIYPGKQHTWKLMAALRDLLSEGAINPTDIEVRFYGPHESWLEKEHQRYGISSIVKQYGTIPKQDALEKQWESQLLLLLDWDDTAEFGVYPGKVFEYFAARRPILAVGGREGNVISWLLKETNAGAHAPGVEDVKNALRRFYKEYKSTGNLAYAGDETAINKYSFREMANKFASALNKLT